MNPDRFYFRLFGYWVAVVYTLIALACFLGPDRWFTSSSLTVFHDLLPIPWACYGILFAGVPVLMVFERARRIAYVLGFILCGFFVLLTVYFTIFADEIRNPIVSGLVLLTPLVLLAGIRYAAKTYVRRNP